MCHRQKQQQMSVCRYNRSSTQGLRMATVNPCNNFIIDYLMRTKIKSDKQVCSRYYMYNLAIESVRKYPLPLICEEQLSALEGFGNFFIGRVAKLIKNHYLRGRMPTQQEMEEDDRDHLQGIRENETVIFKEAKINQEQEMKRSLLKQTCKQSDFQADFDVYEEPEESQRQEQKDPETKIFQRLMLQQHYQRIIKEKEQETEQKQSKLVGAQKIGRRDYRPRIKTQPFQILQAILKLQEAGKRPIKKGDINEYMFNQRREKMSGWTQIRDRFIEFGYIIPNVGDKDEVIMTKKGRDYIRSVLPDEINSQQEQRDESNSSQQKRTNGKLRQTRPLDQVSRVRNPYMETNSHRGKAPVSRNPPIRYKNIVRVHKQPLNPAKVYRAPILLYSTKTEHNLKDEEKIVALLDKLGQFRGDRIEIGDFAWEVDAKLLDFLLFRFKSEGFDLDQFYYHCQRARHSQCKNIFFIFQQFGPESKAKTSASRQNFMDSLYANSRVAGFNVIKSTGITQTISIIINLTHHIRQLIKSPVNYQGGVRPLQFMGSLREFSANVRQFKPAIVRNVAVSCLRCVPHLSREMIKKVVGKMPGMWYLYKKLKLLDSGSERKRFLYWFLQQFNPNKGSIRLIVDLLFFENYDQ